MAQGPAKSGEKEIRRKWPHESGLIAETTKQEGRQLNLIPTEKSLVDKRDKVGMVD